jgi:hypothetical protein
MLALHYPNSMHYLTYHTLYSNAVVPCALEMNQRIKFWVTVSFKKRDPMIISLMNFLFDDLFMF